MDYITYPVKVTKEAAAEIKELAGKEKRTIPAQLGIMIEKMIPLWKKHGGFSMPETDESQDDE